MRRRLCEAAPVIYYGAVEALASCLSRGMLSRDGMWWAGCDGAHLGGVSRNVVVMHEGRTSVTGEVLVQVFRSPPARRIHDSRNG